MEDKPQFTRTSQDSHGRALIASMPAVFASGWGVAVGLNGILVYSFPHFTNSWSEEFGWSHFASSGAISAAMVGILLAVPQMGRLIDRYGFARTVPLGILIFAAVLLGISLLVSSIPALYFAYFAVAVLGAGTSSVCYARAITARFDRNKGLALGAMNCGPGVSAVFLPWLLPPVIAAYGWRGGYVALALLAVTALPGALFLSRGIRKSASPAARSESGMTMREVIRTRTFALLMIGLITSFTAFAGALLNLAPMLKEMGQSQGYAETTLSVLGIAVIIGRLGTGALLDRMRPSIVAPIVVGLPTIGFVILALGGAQYGIIFAALLGLGMGADADIGPYMTARYFGLKSFGEIFGWIFSLTVVGYLVTPAISAAVHAIAGYPLLLWVWVALGALSVVAFSRLGDYPLADRA